MRSDEALRAARQLDIDDRLDLLPAEGVEDDDLVDPVEQLRPEVLADGVHHALADADLRGRQLGEVDDTAAVGQHRIQEVLAAEVAGHDHDRVLEVDGATLGVGQPAVVEQLEQDVEHLRVRLLDLVEEDDRVGPAADGLGQLAGLVVADVARRRTDQARDGVALLVLAHVDADERLLVVEQEFGERPRRLGLADAGRTEEQERADRPVRVAEAGPRRADGVGDGLDRLLLADDALAQAVLHVDQLLDLALEQPADRDARPAADDLGDVLLVDLLLDQRPAALAALAERRLGLLELLLELADLVLQPGGALPVGCERGLLELAPRRVELLLDPGDLVELLDLALPARLELGRLLLGVGQLLLELARAAPSRPCPSPCAGPRARSRAA